MYPDKHGMMDFPHDLICFGKDFGGRWWFKHPDTYGLMLTQHQVAEHEDGTITVSPSIMVPKLQPFGGSNNGETIHGFLERGVWRDC